MFGIQYSPVLVSLPARQATPLAERCINTTPTKSFSAYRSAWPTLCDMPSSPSLPLLPAESTSAHKLSPPPLLDFFSTPIRPHDEIISPVPERRRDERLTRQRTPANPFQRSSKERRSKHRDQFLTKVQGQRTKKRWDARGDQVR